MWTNLLLKVAALAAAFTMLAAIPAAAASPANCSGGNDCICYNGVCSPI